LRVAWAGVMSDRIYNVLFICTANSARSIMAEMIMNLESHGRFRAYSAGAMPRGHVDDHVIDLGRSLGYAVETLRSKGWDEFAGPDAPDMDLIITLSDTAAGEAPPQWPGHPATAQWRFPELVDAEMTESARALAFRQEFRELAERIRLLLLLPTTSLDRLSLETHARQAGAPA